VAILIDEIIAGGQRDQDSPSDRSRKDVRRKCLRRIDQDQNVKRGVERFGQAFLRLPIQISHGARRDRVGTTKPARSIIAAAVDLVSMIAIMRFPPLLFFVSCRRTA
jgi:hypothetical protein